MFAIESPESLEQLRRDPESITHAVIVGFRGLSLAVLNECCNLESLRITGFYHTGANPEWADTIDDFSTLSSLPALRTLAIHDCRHFDESQLAIVANITQIRALSITTFMQTIEHFDALQGNSRLTALQLTCVSDLSFLEGMPNLEQVFVSDKWAARPLRNLQALSSLQRLRSLLVNSQHHKSVSVSAACPVQFTCDQNADELDWWNRLTETG